jgi:hypothetical protein
MIAGWINGKKVQGNIILDSKTEKAKSYFPILNTTQGTRFLFLGIFVTIMSLVVVGAVIFLNLPVANAFNIRVEQLFMQSQALPVGNEIKLLEILAGSGTAFSEVLSSYRFIIFVLLIFATALLLSSLIFILTIITLNNRLREVERAGLQINSLIINREESAVYLNNMEFSLTGASFEALSVLCEARMDDDFLTGLDVESIITGKSISDCDEAAGATRIKRLRDSLGNQILSQTLIRNFSKRGYMLSIDKEVIKII